VEVSGVPVLAWKLLEEIKAGDSVAMNRTPQAVGGFEDEYDVATALLLGAFVSEGFVSEGRAGFSNVDQGYFAVMVDLFDAVVGGPRYVNSRTLPSGKLLRRHGRSIRRRRRRTAICEQQDPAKWQAVV
jgi:DNA gyrase subunit A